MSILIKNSEFMKLCIICNVAKDVLDFKKDKRRSDGFTNTCKSCMNKKGLEYYYRTKDDRKDSINENRRKSYQINKDIENQRSHEYKKNNSDKIKEYNKEYQLKNKEFIAEKHKGYYENNKQKINAYTKKYTNDKLKSDDLFKLKFYLRSMIRNHFNRGGYSKNSKTQEILGCSFEDFKLHLESMFEDWMTWENRGLFNGELNYGWDIDHIIPISSANTEEEVLLLNHYTNLQPLCSYTNRYIKRDKV